MCNQGCPKGLQHLRWLCLLETSSFPLPQEPLPVSFYQERSVSAFGPWLRYVTLLSDSARYIIWSGIEHRKSGVRA